MGRVDHTLDERELRDVEALTDNSGGTASDTIAAITDVPTRNAVASLAAKLNALLERQKPVG